MVFQRKQQQQQQQIHAVKFNTPFVPFVAKYSALKYA